MPYAHEHSARLQKPEKFDATTYRRTEGGKLFGGRLIVPKSIGVIWGKLKGKASADDPVIPQALRFPTTSWTVEKAKKWLADNKVKYITFEPAAKEKAGAKRFTKDLIRIGNFDANGKELDVTEERMRAWIENTQRAKMEAWVPFGYHTDDPYRNVGWVDVGSLRIEGDRLVGELDIIDPEASDMVERGLVKEVSVGIAAEYTDEDGTVIGEVLEHVAIVLDPVVKSQGSFERQVAAHNTTAIYELSNKNRIKEGEKGMDPIETPEGLSEEGTRIFDAFKGLLTGLFTDFSELKKALAALQKEKPDEPAPEPEPAAAPADTPLEVIPAIETLKTDTEKALEMANKALVETADIRLQKQVTEFTEGLMRKDLGAEQRDILVTAYAIALKSGEKDTIEKIVKSVADLPNDPRAERIFGKTGAQLASTELDVKEVEDYAAKHKITFTEAYERLTESKVV